MSEITNINEPWKKHTFSEVETFITDYFAHKPIPVSPVHLTLTSRQYGSTVRIYRYGSTPDYFLNAEIKYSVDDGITWNDYTFNNASGITITLNNGESVKFKGNNNGFSYDSTYYYQFILNGQLEGSGDVTSLLNGEGGDAILSENCFYKLFYDCKKLTKAPALPSTALAANCYQYMFQGCTTLTTAPALPATTLASYCYYCMFQGCTALRTAPALPATRVEQYCYQSMFYNCSNLTTAPAELPATVLASYCYQNMFYNCSNLTTAPAELPATVLASYCYDSMFKGCTSLTTAPALPATTVGQYCCQNMFQGCTSLTTAPAELPATVLAANCYRQMFNGCSNLTTAPVLPATTLEYYCYDSMFSECTKLNYIKAMFTTTPSSSYTGYWVSGVAATGTFVKNSAATWDVTGTSGVPSGWTVETASE